MESPWGKTDPTIRLKRDISSLEDRANGLWQLIQDLKSALGANETELSPSGDPTFATVHTPQVDNSGGVLNLNPSGGNVVIGGFTKHGSDAPANKKKLLTGTTSSTPGADTTVAHGLTLSKIVDWEVVLTDSNGDKMKANYWPTNQYRFASRLTSTNCVVYTDPTSGTSTICNKAFTVIIEYQE